jgi:hypothetical protein
VRKGILSLAMLLLAAARAHSLEITPVANGTLMGGQYFFRGDKSSLNGNATALVAPVLRSSDRWAYLPIYSANYQGTKGVGDSVGAGTIFQQEMDHRVSVSGLYTADGSDWKLKPGVSYKRQFLKETRDEAWGHGLFDYEKIGAGFEAEKTYREPFSYRLGFDLYRIRFPNYKSLESEAGTDPQGNPLGRERAGANVLDSFNMMLSFSGSRPFPYEDPVVSLQGGASLLYQTYPDQHIVDARGQLRSAIRHDVQPALSGSVGYPRPLRLWDSAFRLDTRFSVGYVYNGSNQNTFDAARTKFVSDAYGYHQVSAGPSWTLAWGSSKRPAWASMGLRYEETLYTGRLAQDGDGVYGSSRQHQDRYLFTLGYAYPVAAGFYLKAQSNLLWQRSNQTYEKTYAYNYRAENFLLGFTYEY